MSRPTLDSTTLGTNMTNGTTSPIDLIPVGKKLQSLCHQNYQQDYQGTRIQTHHHHIHLINIIH